MIKLNWNEDIKKQMKYEFLKYENIIKTNIFNIGKISDKVRRMDIEIHMIPDKNITLMLYSLDDENNEVFDVNKNVFSGSKEIVSIDLAQKINIIDDEQNDEYETFILITLKDIIKKYTTEINIPIFLMYHGPYKKYDIKNDRFL